ncbi:MAG: 1-deoxy-D-xylulose-5-phosphate reductoisomerase [Endomicrobiia bacterium]
MKKVLILGSTGSIGQNVLNVIKINKDKFKVIGLTSKSNIELFKKQIEEFNVPYGCIASDKTKNINIKNTKILFSENGLLEIIDLAKPDILVNSLVGISGLKPLLYAIDKNIPLIALANKESIVVAGKLIQQKLKNKNTELIPIDSEHSAIYQCLKNENIKNIEKVIITASGGPLFKNKIKNKTVEKIVSHPVWKMGKKISVDSATMVNKGFECIEAHYLFNIPYEKIDILIHPQAIIHSFIKFLDGNILACMFYPDMRIPISYALGCGKERILNLAKKIDLLTLNKIKFYKPDYKKFPLLKLLLDCAKENKNSYLVVFNAANEVLVEKFINKEINFDTIYKVIKNIICSHKPKQISSVEEIFEIDKETRKKVQQELEK